jgi:cytochrome b
MKRPDNKLRVWDLPTRIFHWSLVFGVLGLAVTGTLGGDAMGWHFRFGYSVLTLLLFRLLWGFIGGRWSRFSSFIYSPASLLNYLRGRGKAEHSVGHTPIGAASVFAMLFFLLAQVGSGLLSDDEIAFAGPLSKFVSNATVALASSYHAAIGKWIVLLLVSLHLVAIVFYQRRKHKLLGAMLHGDKQLQADVPGSRDDANTRLMALLLLGICALLVYGLSSLG